jgi:hypothetical protein
MPNGGGSQNVNAEPGPWFLPFISGPAKSWIVNLLVMGAAAQFVFTIITAGNDLYKNLFGPSPKTGTSIVVNPRANIEYGAHAAESGASTTHLPPDLAGALGVEIDPTVNVVGYPGRTMLVRAYLEAIGPTGIIAPAPAPPNFGGAPSPDATFKVLSLDDTQSVDATWLPYPPAYSGTLQVHVVLFTDAAGTIKLADANSTPFTIVQLPTATQNPSGTPVAAATATLTGTSVASATATLTRTPVASPIATEAVPEGYVVVPDVVGAPIFEAVHKLTAAGLTVPSPGFGQTSLGVWLVDSTDPVPGALVPVGSAVHLRASFECTSPRCP